MNEAHNQNAAAAGMPQAIYQDLEPQERLAKIKETADQVVEHNYKRPYSEEEVTEIRKQISDLCVQISDLIGDLRSGGDYVDEDCYVFMDFTIGKAGLYNGEGVLLNQKDITPEMSQSTIFSALRDNLLPDDQSGETLMLEAPEGE